MAAYRRVYDSRHPQADCKEPGSAAEPCARQSSLGYLYLKNILRRAIAATARRRDGSAASPGAGGVATVCR